MFSPRERDYLRLLAEPPALGLELGIAFPNPVYRRKLSWGIRRKVTAALPDWELYAAAAERNERVRVVVPRPDHETVPVYTDPFVSVFRTVMSTFGRRPTAPPPPPGHRRDEV